MLRRLPQFFRYRMGRHDLLKVCFQLEDGLRTETVLACAAVGSTGQSLNTLCVSSQVGCGRCCHHCSSGRRPFGRDLTTEEILGQVAAFAVDNQVHRVVFNGMGEPLDNRAAVDAARLLSERCNLISCCCDGESLGVNSSSLGVTKPEVAISTVGKSSEIQRLARSAPGVFLALSVMPNVHRTETIESLLDSTDSYAVSTGKPVTLSYTMIQGLDTATHLQSLLSYMRGRTATHGVRLVQYHSWFDHDEILGSGASPSSLATIRHFIACLRDHGCTVSFGQYCDFPVELGCHRPDGFVAASREHGDSNRSLSSVD